MAKIGAPHGIRGEVRIAVFAQDPSSLVSHGPLRAEDGRPVKITQLRRSGERVIATLAGIGDRTAAEALCNQTLFLERGQLPPVEDDDTYYWSDLIGLAVEDTAGARIGRVLAMHDFGAGDIVEIERDGAASVLVPFTRAAVPVVDIAGGRLVVDPPAGLMDDA